MLQRLQFTPKDLVDHGTMLCTDRTETKYLLEYQQAVAVSVLQWVPLVEIKLVGIGIEEAFGEANWPVHSKLTPHTPHPELYAYAWLIRDLRNIPHCLFISHSVWVMYDTSSKHVSLLC